MPQMNRCNICYLITRIALALSTVDGAIHGIVIFSPSVTKAKSNDTRDIELARLQEIKSDFARKSKVFNMHGLYQLLNMLKKNHCLVNSAVNLSYNSPVFIRSLPTCLLNEFSQTKCVHQNCNSDWRLTTNIHRLSSKLGNANCQNWRGGGHLKRKFILGEGEHSQHL